MRVVVADDSVLFREGLTRVLVEHGHDVVATVGDATSAIAAIEEHRPDLAIVDIRMPPGMESDGARLAADVRSRLPDVGVLLLSQHIELRDCLGLIGTAGFGYLLKDRVLDLADFDASITRVAGGGSALDPLLIKALVRSQRAPSGLSSLTEREREVLALVAEGQSNAAIAATLHLSERTVETHMRSVFTRLGLSDDGTTHRRVRAVLTYLDSRVGAVSTEP